MFRQYSTLWALFAILALKEHKQLDKVSQLLKYG
jgi:hypothetical protein